MYEGSLKPNSEYRAHARYQLSGRWLMAVLVILITFILTRALSTRGVSYSTVNGQLLPHVSGTNSFASIIGLIISGPLNLGVMLYFLKLARGQNPQLEDIFSGFKNFGNAFLAALLITIFTILWTLAFAVPGIILIVLFRNSGVGIFVSLIIITSILASVSSIMAYLRYSMTYYILNDNPQMSSLEAIKASKEFMNGKKGKLFMLILSFIGWFILGALALVIGLLWVGAYYNTAIANFYEDLKRNSIVENPINNY